MKLTAEVVIIGAGIQGTSVAYHLAKNGLTDVLVLEMDVIGSGSSGRSAAMVTYHTFSPSRLDLIRISRGEYANFEQEMGIEPGYRRIGQLRLVTERQARCMPCVRPEDELGQKGCVLSHAEIEHLVPGLNLEDIAFGLYNSEDALLDPHTVYSAYAREARRLGVRIMEGVRADGLDLKRGRVQGVVSKAGAISTPRIVNAAGFLARQVGRWAGLDLPIVNYKRHIFVAESVPTLPRAIPFVHDEEADWYFRREGTGLIMGMGASESDEENPRVEWSFLSQVVEHALYRAPILAEARIIRGWAGLRPLTPDGDPILGEAPGCAGFFNCCGWGGHGVMHAPAGGLLTAELITDPSASSADIQPFRLERFEKDQRATQDCSD